MKKLTVRKLFRFGKIIQLFKYKHIQNCIYSINNNTTTIIPFIVLRFKKQNFLFTVYWNVFDIRIPVNIYYQYFILNYNTQQTKKVDDAHRILGGWCYKMNDRKNEGIKQ